MPELTTLKRKVTFTHAGDAFEVHLDIYANGIQAEKILRFRNNQNVEGTEEDFDKLDRPTKRAIVRAVQKEYKKTLRIAKQNGRRPITPAR